MNICSNSECERQAKSRGMCNKHYEFWRRNGANGTVLHSLRPSGLNDTEMLGFIMSKTAEHENGCMVWTGAVNSTGYGTLGFRSRNWVAHTLVLTLTQGERPDGKEGCHSRDCVSRCCVNPSHLRWDTRTANVVDTRESNRMKNQKLTREDVEFIKRLWSEQHFTVWDIAQRFDVYPGHIRKILRGEIWV